MIDNLSANTLLIQLAVTLLHFVWQGATIAALLALFLCFVPKHKVIVRYTTSLAALFSCLLVMIATFVSVSGISFEAVAHEQAVLIAGGEAQTKTIGHYTLSDPLYQWLSYLSLAYLAGLLVYTLKLGYELTRVGGLRHQGIQDATPQMQAKLAQLANQLGLRKVPRLLISIKAQTPMAIGMVKPIILLPFSMATNLSNEQIEMLLLHELAHIRRYDYAVNLVQSLAELILFYHPAVRWISNQVRNEREYCSDDVALQYCQNPVAYAHTLADTADICRHHIPQMAVAAAGGDLKGRIERIVASRCSGHGKIGQGQMLGLVPVLVASWIMVGSLSHLSLPGIKSLVGNSHEVETARPPAIAAELTAQLYPKDQSPAKVNFKQTPNSIKTQHGVQPQALPETRATKEKTISEKKARAGSLVSEQLRQLVEDTPPAPAISVAQHPVAAKKQPSMLKPEPAEKLSVKSSAGHKLPPSERQAKPQVRDLFVEPEALRRIQPVYPRLAKRKRVESSIKVSFTINEQGNVTDLSFEDAVGQRAFRNAVRDALRKWRYKPARLNGQPIATKMTKIFEFNLT